MNHGFWDLNMLRDDESKFDEFKTKFNVCPEMTIKSGDDFQKIIDQVLDTVMGAAQTNYPVSVDNKTTTPVALMCKSMIAAAA